MWRWWVVLLLLSAPPVQAATVHASLNRNHVSLGDTVTLNIETDGSIGHPDLSALQRNFRVLGTSRSSRVQVVNGKTSRSSRLGIALQPRRAGTLVVPSLDIAGAGTPPLTLYVAAAPSGGQGKLGDLVFMKVSVLSSSPYIGEQTIYTVRLFYQPGVQGSLGDPHVDGARVIRLDNDHRYTVRRNGYAYKVLERSWALLPGRSGTLTIDGPTFHGRSFVNGNIGSLLNNPQTWLNNPNALLNGPFPGFGKQIDAAAPTLAIQARAAPANAGKPWLPAREVRLKLTGLPASGKLRAGVPVTVTLLVSAEGEPADALPEPALPTIAGARVYPDQTQDMTDKHGEWLQGTRTRSFAIVPGRSGTLIIPAITLDWWSVVHNRAEQARLPAHTLQVSAAAAPVASKGNPPAAPASTGGTVSTSHDAVVAAAPAPAPAQRVRASQGRVATHPTAWWRDLALASFALWIVAVIAGLAWLLVHRRAVPDSTLPVVVGTPHAAGVSSVATAATMQPRAGPDSSNRLRKQVMDAARAGDVVTCEHALLAWARTLRPEIAHAGVLRDALADPAQRDALDVLQRARWRNGDTASACVAVAGAFANGFMWRAGGKAAPGRGAAALPPLYPS